MRWLGRLGWCDLQVVGREPYHLTVTIHFGVDRAVGCPDYSALRERLAPKAIVTNKLNAIPRLECVHSHFPLPASLRPLFLLNLQLGMQQKVALKERHHYRLRQAGIRPSG